MGKPSPPAPVKLFIGVLYSDDDILSEALTILESRYGPVDYTSRQYRFDLTNYYESEMGPGLIRLFWGFEQLIDPSELPDIKLSTNEVEDQFSYQGCRKINLDPGYLDFHKVILASVKDRAQKIYLAKGIYADPTLYYLKGKFHHYDWTLPDFKPENYHQEFINMRILFRTRLKAGPTSVS
jgi:hypothetical protein